MSYNLMYDTIGILKCIDYYRSAFVINLIKPIELALTSGKFKVRHITCHSIITIVQNHIFSSFKTEKIKLCYC
jgi:hypothetical protein